MQQARDHNCSTMNLNKALASLGASSREIEGPPAAAVSLARAPPPMTKKQKEALAEKEKLEKKKKKAAALIAGAGKVEKDEKEKKEKKAAKAAEDAATAAAEAAAAPAEAAAPDANAAKEAESKAKVAKAKTDKKVPHVRSISQEERRIAIEAERQRAEAAEAAFAEAYRYTAMQASLHTVPMDYVVRSAAELENAREAARVMGAAQVATAAAAELEHAVRKAVTSRSCEVSFEDWQILRLASASA